MALVSLRKIRHFAGAVSHYFLDEERRAERQGIKIDQRLILPSGPEGTAMSYQGERRQRDSGQQCHGHGEVQQVRALQLLGQCAQEDTSHKEARESEPRGWGMSPEAGQGVSHLKPASLCSLAGSLAGLLARLPACLLACGGSVCGASFLLRRSHGGALRRVFALCWA